MTNVITDRLEQFEISQISQKAQTELKLRKQHIAHRVGKVYRDVVRQRDQLVGRIQDGSKQTLYATASQGFESAASLFAKGPRLLHKSANRLEEAATRLKSQEAALFAPPVEDYDELNVKQICQEIRDLDAHSLLKVESYEKANKNRVTVLREVERLMTR